MISKLQFSAACRVDRGTVSGRVKTLRPSARMREIPPLQKKTLELFFRKIDKFGRVPKHVPSLGRCWIWKNATDQKGYGVFSIGGRKFRANRVSYKVHIGSPPKRLLVCHKCDNPSCVNPSHFFLGTGRDNMMDMVKKGRINFWPGVLAAKNRLRK